MAAVTLFKGFSVPLRDVNLIEVLNEIISGTYKSQIETIRSLMQSDQQKLASQLKMSLPAFTVSGSFKGGRTLKDLTYYSKFIVLDLDKLSFDELNRAFAETVTIPYTYACFKSPSGNGLKILIEVCSEASDHLKAYNQVAGFYEQALKIQIDRSGKDITRLCFVSYDPTAFINESHLQFPVSVNQLKTTDSIEKTQKSTNYSEDRFKQCLDITEKSIQYEIGNRNNFIYALACNCNRFGLPINEAICLIENQYDLPKGELQNTIISAYKHHQFEYDTIVCNTQQTEQIETASDDDILLNMPFIPSDVFNSLPEILQSGCRVFDNQREKEIFLTGALTILSGCLNEVQGVYDQKILYPNLNCFIVAPAASGKGSFSFAKTLGMSYHQKILKLSLEEKAVYEQALLQYKSDLKKRKNSEPPAEEPKKPAFKILYIPGNSSSAAVIQHLVENGGKGISCETEADTIGNSLKQDWGGYSDLLRKAFHHECVSYSRKTNNEYFEIPTPQLSMAISGTPSQVTGLVNSAEDGLFSRIIFYVFKNKVEWRDVAPKSSKPVLDKHFDLLSNKVLDVVEFLEKYPTEFHLTDNQWAILNREFGIWLKEVAIFVSEEAISVVKRLGVISFRIAMILSTLRKYENGVSDKDIYCDDTDFKNTLQLVKVYKEHAMYMFSKLPKSGIVNKRMKDFYDALPTSFHRKEGIAIAEQMNIKVRTVDKYLTELVKKELISKEEYGTYCKRC